MYFFSSSFHINSLIPFSSKPCYKFNLHVYLLTDQFCSYLCSSKSSFSITSKEMFGFLQQVDSHAKQHGGCTNAKAKGSKLLGKDRASTLTTGSAAVSLSEEPPWLAQPNTLCFNDFYPTFPFGLCP
ncbi:unnamed protein product [Lepeophtheirus salmonis]|uniref:(salmon louse) hypothetical protein n=1 Tax=Lepeophtheirus salmonis TaxID=72036 RepID=A0A7R8HA70_LEPSM|nr:unnamed protein product [Lepeophtheirus salmonis]CAF2967704.1 unnamed protein product [Lepeophtheirus salmonis]